MKKKKKKENGAKEEKLIIILTLFPPNHFSPSIGQAAHIFIFLTASVAAEKTLLPDLFTSRKKKLPIIGRMVQFFFFLTCLFLTHA